MNSFETFVDVRFAHCDPAGIVFFPRYFEMLNGVVEDWFSGPLALPFSLMHGEMGCGIPTVHLDTTFERASRLGDRLRFTLTAQRIGASSCVLNHVAQSGGQVCVRFKQTIAWVNLAQMKAHPWPESVRARMQDFLAPSGD
jgi:4-hydroxybenzoyl-CoA thioesterase